MNSFQTEGLLWELNPAAKSTVVPKVQVRDRKEIELKNTGRVSDGHFLISVAVVIGMLGMAGYLIWLYLF